MPRPTHQSFHQIWQDVLDRRPLVLQFGTGAIWESTRLPVFLVSAYAFSIWVLWHLNLAPNLGTGASSLTAILSMGESGLFQRMIQSALLHGLVMWDFWGGYSHWFDGQLPVWLE